MQTKLMKLAVGVVAGLMTVSAFGQIKWAPNYQSAIMQAKGAGKLVMIEFYTTWDKNGKKLEAGTFADKKVIAAASKFVNVRVNIEKEGKELGAKYHITNYPSLLFIDGAGRDLGII